MAKKDVGSGIFAGFVLLVIILWFIKYTWPFMLVAAVGGLIWFIVMKVQENNFGYRNTSKSVSKQKDENKKTIRLKNKKLISHEEKETPIQDTKLNVSNENMTTTFNLECTEKQKMSLSKLLSENIVVLDFFVNKLQNINKDIKIENLNNHFKKAIVLNEYWGLGLYKFLKNKSVYIEDKVKYLMQYILYGDNALSHDAPFISLNKKQMTGQEIKVEVVNAIASSKKYNDGIGIAHLFITYLNTAMKMKANKEFSTIIINALKRYKNEEECANKTFDLYNFEYAMEIVGKLNKVEYLNVIMFFSVLINSQLDSSKITSIYNEMNFNEMNVQEIISYVSSNIQLFRQNIDDLIMYMVYIQLIKGNLKEVFYIYQQKALFVRQLVNSKRKYELLNNQADDDSISIVDIDIMSGIDFEEFLGKLFRRMGYESVVTPASGDYGIDLLVKKDNQTVAVQAKRYSESNVVGIKAVQEALGGKSYYKADKAMVITTSSFTKNAQNLAKENGIILWDRHELKNKIDELF